MSALGRALVVGAAALAAVPLVGCESVAPTHANISYDDAPFVEVPDPPQQTPPLPKEPHVLDVYLPEDPSRPPPVLVVVNGGGWFGTNEDDVGILGGAQHLLDMGFAVVSVRYHAADGVNGDGTFGDSEWPLLAQDVDRAIRWVRAYAGDLGVDASRVIAAGHSAGAHLLAAVALGGYAAADLPADLQAVSSRPDGLILLAGPYDLRASQFPPVPDPLGIGQPVENLLACDHRATPIEPVCEARVTDASPALHPTTQMGSFPRSFIAVAKDDDVVPWTQSLGFAYGLCTVGRTVWWEEADTGGHGLDELEDAKLAQFLSHWKPDVAPNPAAPPDATCGQP